AFIASADLLSGGVQPGRTWRTRPAEPAWCGEAIEVPLYSATASSKPVMVVPATAASTRTPGAVTSGLSRSKLPAGPRELDAASTSGWLVNMIAGYGIPALTASLPAAKSRRASPSAWRMPKAGTVVPGTEGMTPPAALLAITTATAPAAAALSTLIVNEQPPRRTTAIAPAKLSGG